MSTLTLTPGTITRRLRALGVDVWKTSGQPGAYARVHLPGDTTPEQVDTDLARVRAWGIQQGYDVAADTIRGTVTLTLPEPEPADEPATEAGRMIRRAVNAAIANGAEVITAQEAPANPEYAYRGDDALRIMGARGDDDALVELDRRRAEERAAWQRQYDRGNKPAVAPAVARHTVAAHAATRVAAAIARPENTRAILDAEARSARAVADRDPAVAAYQRELADALDAVDVATAEAEAAEQIATAPMIDRRTNPRTGAVEWRAYPYGRAHADGGAGPWTTDRDQAARILAVVTERVPEPLVPLTATDADGTTWHATDEYGKRLDVFGAALSGGPAHVRYRRELRVTFPRYSKWPVVAEAMRAATLPHERIVTHSGEHWGGDDVAVTTELIFPSSSWCVDCGHELRPDQYGRVSPYAVYRDPAGRSLPPTRNLDHLTAHLLAAAWLAQADDGRTAHVGIDACG